jgi:hypothetical protein
MIASIDKADCRDGSVMARSVSSRQRIVMVRQVG